jgi:hypothetical protein
MGLVEYKDLLGSKNTIAFKQANSVSSMLISLNGFTSSSITLQLTRLTSFKKNKVIDFVNKFKILCMYIPAACLGKTKSFPNNKKSFKCIERRATPNNKCSPACARSSAT